MKLVVFSICLNEEKTIGELLDRIPVEIPGITEIEKVVIDDGSSDGTVGIAKQHGAEVFSNYTQKRLGFSFQRAVSIAQEKGADIAVNIDGDLQYQPEDIPLLVAPIVDKKADFVAADRFSDPQNGGKKRPVNMPFGKYWGNICGSWVISKLSKKHFNDVTSGFRAYNRNALMSLNLKSRFTYTQESFQVLAYKNLNILSVPVKVTYFKERKSRVVSSFTNFLLRSAVNIIRAFRDFAPLSFFGWLGFAAFIAGVIPLTMLGIHYFQTGALTPYKYLGFLGIFFSSIAILVWIVGLVGDMLDRVLNNQEKIIRLLKELKYKKD